MLPLVDIAPLLEPADTRDIREVAGVAKGLDEACRHYGFVRIAGHGVPASQVDELIELSTAFFALPEHAKAEIAMVKGGPAWRGWFPVGGELTSGRPDRKEGIYFGEQLASDHPAVRAGEPLHGLNLFPDEPAGIGDAVLSWIETMTRLGTALLGSLALGLGLDEQWFATNVTTHPTTLFRIFHYPPHLGGEDDWGVGEHTDYGLLTLLAQDGTGGLEVHDPDTEDSWISVPPDRDVLVVNLGDMLERMTKGIYRSTVHRVRNTSGVGRMSFPFFLDPGWDATVTPMPLGTGGSAEASRRRRWDGGDVHTWSGTYGEYLTAKVAKVFPELFAATTTRLRSPVSR